MKKIPITGKYVATIEIDLEGFWDETMRPFEELQEDFRGNRISEEILSWLRETFEDEGLVGVKVEKKVGFLEKDE